MCAKCEEKVEVKRVTLLRLLVLLEASGMTLNHIRPKDVEEDPDQYGAMQSMATAYYSTMDDLDELIASIGGMELAKVSSALKH